MSRTQRLALFAVPAPGQRAQIEALIAEIVGVRGGTRFPAHMTLYAGDFESEADLLTLTRDLAKTTPAFAHPVVGVTSGTEHYKCVFIQLAPVPVADALAERVRQTAITKDYILDPHVSLLYGDIAPGAAAEIAENTSLGLQRIRFSELLVNAKGVGTGAPVDVASWRTVLRLPLGSGRVGSGRTS